MLDLLEQPKNRPLSNARWEAFCAAMACPAPPHAYQAHPEATETAGKPLPNEATARVSMTQHVCLDANAETLGVYRGDAAEFHKWCNVLHLSQTRIPNDVCDGATVKGWEVDAIAGLLRHAVTGFTGGQGDFPRSRARRSWRDVKLGVEA